MKKIIFLVVFAFLFLGCKSKLKTRELGAYTYKTSAVSIIDSKLLVNAYGQGQTKKECLNNATINALRDVIFKGISDGNPNTKQPPILGKVNAEKTYADFFDSFTSPSGKYLNYAELYDKPISQSYSKKERKLNRVENMTLEFQILIDRKGLVTLFNQPDIIKN
jgi:hypothetical protein